MGPICLSSAHASFRVKAKRLHFFSRDEKKINPGARREEAFLVGSGGGGGVSQRGRKTFANFFVNQVSCLDA